MSLNINNFFQHPRDLLIGFINSGHKRSVKARKNIIASLFIKGMSVVFGFLLVPITLEYLDQTRYGIWITVSSILSWFAFFELGLGNGLRNKLATALAKKDYNLGRHYVSTTYAILTVVISVVSLMFFASNHLIDWTVVFNTGGRFGQELTTLTYIVFGFFFVRFVFELIGYVLLADQRPALSNLIKPTGSLISLGVIYILTKTTQGSLVYIGLTLSASPLLMMIAASFYFYGTDYKKIAPSLKYVDLRYAKELLGLGYKFFLIQVAGLIMYSSSNFIITQFFGPAMVTPYHIAYRLFSLISMLFMIVLTPYWSAFTEAWEKKEVTWIKTTVRRLLYVWGMISSGGVLLLFLSPKVFRFWVGEQVEIPFYLSGLLLLFFISSAFGGIFNMFINGVGKIKLQLILSFISALLFIPLCIFLIEVFNLGVEALVIASITCNINGYVIAPLQYYKIINDKARGIWNI
jgi:O-antigen/teichoic acid export membrane protein